MSSKSRYSGQQQGNKFFKFLARRMISDCQALVDASGDPGWVVSHTRRQLSVSVVFEPDMQPDLVGVFDVSLRRAACLSYIDRHCDLEGCRGHVIYGRLVPAGGLVEGMGVLGV